MPPPPPPPEQTQAAAPTSKDSGAFEVSLASSAEDAEDSGSWSFADVLRHDARSVGRLLRTLELSPSSEAQESMQRRASCTSTTTAEPASSSEESQTDRAEGQQQPWVDPEAQPRLSGSDGHAPPLVGDAEAAPPPRKGSPLQESSTAVGGN